MQNYRKMRFRIDQMWLSLMRYPKRAFSQSARSILEETSKTSSFVELSHRSTVVITGKDSIKFLQGLTTNQMSKIEKGGDGLYSSFLTPQVHKWTR